MQITGNTMLITGGASGIGLALAGRFLNAGNTVIVCGRRAEKLDEAQTAHADLHTRVCDVGIERERIKLAEWVTGEFPELNVLVNNAGIQRYLNLMEQEPWDAAAQELEINVAAPIHLTRLLLPHLLKRKHSAIVNVTSGLSFSPLARTPIYSATKAALRSFTLSLRYQLRNTSVDVVEVIPPGVNTDLGGVGLHTWGEPLDEFADAVFQRLGNGEREIAYGSADISSRASREELDQIFKRTNPA